MNLADPLMTEVLDLVGINGLVDDFNCDLCIGPDGSELPSDNAHCDDGCAGDWQADTVDPEHADVLEPSNCALDDVVNLQQGSEVGNVTPPADHITLHDISDGDVNFVVNGFHPDDIHQGGLGDCWLLSTLSAVADENPQMLQDLLLTQNYEPGGEIEVKLFNPESKQWEVVTIQDKFPVSSEGKPVYAQAGEGNEAWPMIFEAAVAKMMTGDQFNYSGIDADSMQRAYEMLTGNPGIELNNNNGTWTDGSGAPIDIMQQLTSAEASGSIVTAVTPGSTDPTAATEKDGIVQNHAYTILDTYSKDGVDLVQLRNPWGNTEWSGSENLWATYPHIAAELEANSTDDGKFWMPVEDFQSYFSAVNVHDPFPDVSAQQDVVDPALLADPTLAVLSSILGPRAAV